MSLHTIPRNIKRENETMKILAVLVIGVVVIVFGLRRFERMNLYFPMRELMATPAQVGMPYEEVEMQTSDGVVIHGWWIPFTVIPAKTGIHRWAPADNRRGDDVKTMLFCHGNGGNISHRLDRAKRLVAAGANVFLFDYRGYGKSAGKPSELGTYRDAEAAYRYLTEKRGLPSAKIVLYGESLGGAVAVETAVHHPVGGVILDSTFTSAVEMANHYFPWLPARLIMRYPYDSLSKMAGMKAPLLFLHSPQDDIVPFALGRKLYEAAPQPKQFVELLGDHNEGYVDTGDAYIRAVSHFLKELK